jgi:tetratricopeptide (TPR) repeat protein
MNNNEQRTAKSEQRITLQVIVFLCSLFVARCLCWSASEAYYNYMQGMVEERAGNVDQALAAYEKAVKEDPHAVQVFRDIAELRLRTGQPAEALRAAERVRELAPKDPMSYIFLGNVRVAQGDLAKAAESYADALKIDPTNLRALENLGNYYALTNPEKALEYYERYLVISPRDPDINFQIAIVHHRRGHYSKALTYYKESIENEPAQIASHLALADLYEQQKSTASAIAAYTRASELQPGNPLVHSRLGSLYYRDRKWDEAWKAFKQAETSAPKDSAVHYSLARVAEEQKAWKEAAHHAEQAWVISQDPQFLPLAAYYMTMNRRPEAAIKFLEKAREFDPDNANVLLFLGMNYMDLDKPELAREYLAKGVERYPNDIQMRFHLGSAEDKLGHFDAATTQFEKVLAIDPKNSAAMNYLGYSWAERGIRLEEAEKLLRKAVSLEPESGAYLDSLGWVRYKQKAPCEAAQFLTKAVQYAQDPVIFEHLGDAQHECGQVPAALQAWSKALSMNPKNEALLKKVNEQGARFLGSKDVRKYGVYLSGNFKQVTNLDGNMQFKGRMNRRQLQTAGTFRYERPDRIILDVPATDKTEALQYILNGDQFSIHPGPTHPFLDQMARDGLTSLAGFLSGRLEEQLTTTVNPKVGLRTKFSRPNPSGGHDEIEVVSYDYVEGLWLPSTFRVKNETTGWSADLGLSNWVVNESHREKSKR